ncbi:hypothetical protein BDV37DRAFT_111983 [Aspergillus pseudonomiae]|uniref:Uncharacterized protein n=1 Tax=Aspergillus pseudonomiae TaxID=1506151 RepID=A0A5N7DSS9_9EURO|nr:uncharacterized protein BDV37DRAFT_111983 [Aspergillus pseudonomiae]KAE8409355.1 hypothetical protein BDV37DRAFT_111983 [Aspergillus pseudonomiae]
MQPRCCLDSLSFLFFLFPFLITSFFYPTGTSRLFPTYVSSVIERMNQEMTKYELYDIQLRRRVYAKFVVDKDRRIA